MLDSKNEVHVLGIHGGFSECVKICLKPCYLCNKNMQFHV